MHVLQYNAARLILDFPNYSSATKALGTLKCKTLKNKM